MITLKCKICGGDLTIEEGSHICECEYCGTKQTLPSVDNDVRANAFNRANHFRMQKEFDKAIATYERLLNDDDTDAEAHWGAALSRYGIEYVEDPTTHERIPTCHRLQITSILADADCKAAIENAPDAATRALYEKEAHRIADIQKGILAISANEKPYDIFICYKEADASGRRTPDSAIAQDIYYQLVQEGYRVFFSRITLEDKLGREYEPYIFAALNSARVMLVISTKPEHFNAVWVKNEWSRYLELMRQDRSRLLIPCYKGMDAYDIPDELSMLQSQDMGRVGFIPDLVRNIKKIIVNDEPKQVTPKAPPATGGDNVSALLKRISIFLGDGDWAKADEYCERVLDMDPECAEAYLGKLMVKERVTEIANLKYCYTPFDSSDNYKKIKRFGDDKLLNKLNEYLDHIYIRNEQQRLTGLYNTALKAMEKASTEQACKDAAQLFQNILDFKDSAALSKECLEKAEFCRKDAIYISAKRQMASESIAGYEAAVKMFQDIPLFKDADELIAVCNKKKAEEIAQKDAVYNSAKHHMSVGNINSYEYAINLFRSIPLWRDVNEQIIICNEEIAKLKAKAEAKRLEAERRSKEQRIAAIAAAKKRKESMLILACICIVFAIVLTTVIIPNCKYNAAVSLIDDGEFVEAYDNLIALNGYKDSTEKAADIFEQYKPEKLKVANVGDIVFFGVYEQDNDTSNGKEDIEWRVLAKEDGRILLITDKAIDCQRYSDTYTDTTWEKCSLRKWMNDIFFNTAFSTEEQAKVQSTKISADRNPEYDTDPGNATTDKVFLLSIDEVNKYFNSDKARACIPTAYAKENGAYSYGNTCLWWLRSPGRYPNDISYLSTTGYVVYEGRIVDSNDTCVRPAMWVSVE